MFVDRVLYGGPDVQRVALGAAGRRDGRRGARVGLPAFAGLGLRIVTVAGLGLGTVALALMATWTPATGIAEVAALLGMFGLGFGLTVTPRSTAAVDAVGRAAFGMASATVTVARMLGMAIGLAALTAFGSTTIDRLSQQVYATPEATRRSSPRRSGTAPSRTASSSRPSSAGRRTRPHESSSGSSSSPPRSRPSRSSRRWPSRRQRILRP